MPLSLQNVNVANTKYKKYENKSLVQMNTCTYLDTYVHTYI